MYYNIKESGARIRTLREQVGVSRTVLAFRIGISADALRKIERGTNGCRIDTLILLAEYFQVSLDYLICRKNFIEKTADIFKGLEEQEAMFLLKMVESLKENLVCLKDG